MTQPESPKASPPPSPHNPETFARLRRTEPATKAGGHKAVSVSLKQVGSAAGLTRGTAALAKLNQFKGFDCPSCAWPDPDEERATTEFCENGAKAVASETTRRTIGQPFFAEHSVAELAGKTDAWMEAQGRLAEPLYLAKGASHYRPITWDEAFGKIAQHLRALPSPDDAIFYTSGRASNEAAFCYQLLARQFGTNNLPDCSNMCHESSGLALKETIGVGKGTVTLDDIHTAEAIFLIGQNPGTNHPRMLTALQTCVRKGGTIVAVNPLREAGLLGFAHPQEPQGMLGVSTDLAKLYLQVKTGTDRAFLMALGKLLLADPDCLDRAFIKEHTTGFRNYEAHLDTHDFSAVCRDCGLTESEVKLAASILKKSKATIFCWAMGLTQHREAVPTIQEVVNIQLLLGNLGKPGAGLCPVRGHSNVQGDRTMGIWEKMPEAFLAKLDAACGIQSPRKHGHDTVAAIQAMRAEPGSVFIALGGNFLSASPDTDYTAAALRNCALTVQISTKLNRSHLVTGDEALILPCLGRSERDRQAAGDQVVTMENSMSIVHASRGTLAPVSGDLRSEVAIVCGIGKALFGESSAGHWEAFPADYSRIRAKIAEVVPGFDDYEARAQQRGGFYLPNTARERDFTPVGGKARFSWEPYERITLEDGELLLMTIRSHDQFNTTIYGMNDRYRGIHNERRVVFLNKADMAVRGIAPETPVNLVGRRNGTIRTAPMFLAIPYAIPAGCAAAYFPETNVLVPVDSVAKGSNTPTSKAIPITLEIPDTA